VWYRNEQTYQGERRSRIEKQGLKKYNESGRGREKPNQQGRSISSGYFDAIGGVRESRNQPIDPTKEIIEAGSEWFL